MVTRNDGGGPASDSDLSDGALPWRSRAVLAAGVGVPLGLVFSVDPAAAVADFDASFDDVGLGDGFVADVSPVDRIDDADAGVSDTGLDAAPSHDITGVGFDIAGSEETDFVSMSSANGFEHDADLSDGESVDPVLASLERGYEPDGGFPNVDSESETVALADVAVADVAVADVAVADVAVADVEVASGGVPAAGGVGPVEMTAGGTLASAAGALSLSANPAAVPAPSGTNGLPRVAANQPINPRPKPATRIVRPTTAPVSLAKPAATSARAASSNLLRTAATKLPGIGTYATAGYVLFETGVMLGEGINVLLDPYRSSTTETSPKPDLGTTIDTPTDPSPDGTILWNESLTKLTAEGGAWVDTQTNEDDAVLVHSEHILPDIAEDPVSKPDDDDGNEIATRLITTIESDPSAAPDQYLSPALDPVYDQAIYDDRNPDELDHQDTVGLPPIITNNSGDDKTADNDTNSGPSSEKEPESIEERPNVARRGFLTKRPAATQASPAAAASPSTDTMSAGTSDRSDTVGELGNPERRGVLRSAAQLAAASALPSEALDLNIPGPVSSQAIDPKISTIINQVFAISGAEGAPGQFDYLVENIAPGQVRKLALQAELLSALGIERGAHPPGLHEQGVRHHFTGRMLNELHDDPEFDSNTSDLARAITRLAQPEWSPRIAGSEAAGEARWVQEHLPDLHERRLKANRFVAAAFEAARAEDPQVALRSAGPEVPPDTIENLANLFRYWQTAPESEIPAQSSTGQAREIILAVRGEGEMPTAMGEHPYDQLWNLPCNICDPSASRFEDAVADLMDHLGVLTEDSAAFEAFERAVGSLPEVSGVEVLHNPEILLPFRGHPGLSKDQQKLLEGLITAQEQTAGFIAENSDLFEELAETRGSDRIGPSINDLVEEAKTPKFRLLAVPIEEQKAAVEQLLSPGSFRQVVEQYLEGNPLASDTPALRPRRALETPTSTAATEPNSLSSDDGTAPEALANDTDEVMPPAEGAGSSLPGASLTALSEAAAAHDEEIPSDTIEEPVRSEGSVGVDVPQLAIEYYVNRPDELAVLVNAVAASAAVQDFALDEHTDGSLADDDKL